MSECIDADRLIVMSNGSIVSDGKLTIAEQSYVLDMPVCFGMTLLAVVPPLIKGRMYRWQGILMLAAYAGYVAVLVM